MVDQPREKEIEDFKKIIYTVLCTLEKTCSEKELRKAYREHQGHNINQMIDKFEAGNLYHFLRYKCRSICEVFQNDGEKKILRLILDDQVQPDFQTKASKKKQKKPIAPKLNFPRNGIINSTTFPRSNPQGFNKNKPVNQELTPATSFPFYRSNYSTIYRPANQLTGFQKQDDESSLDSCEEEYIHKPKKECVQSEIKAKPATPSVMNPFEFPNLPKKESGMKQAEEEQNDNEMDESVENSEEEDPTESYKSSTGSSSLVSENRSYTGEKTFRRFEIDDPLFRIDVPGSIINDSAFVVPNPKIMIVPNKLMFEVHLTNVYSPSQFWFQYGDISLSALIDDLEDIYSSQIGDCLVISNLNMKPGLIVVAKNFDMWHRAQICSEIEESGEVRLFFVDIGTNAKVHKTDIRYLLDQFASTPVKALRGSIIGAVPKTKDDMWCQSARKAFFNLVSNKKLFASIRIHREDDDVFELDLADQIQGRSTIADDLINQDQADPEDFDQNLIYAFPLATADKKI